jgi:hypothetical protein
MHYTAPINIRIAKASIIAKTVLKEALSNLPVTDAFLNCCVLTLLYIKMRGLSNIAKVI